MKGVSFIIEKLFTTVYKHLGINGILLLIIAIVIPFSIFHTQYDGPDYSTSTNYTITPATKLKKVAKKDVPPSIDRFADDYYTISLRIHNYYSTEIVHMPYLSAAQEDNEISLLDYDYYSDIEKYDVISPDTCIPAGTEVTVPYYFSGYGLERAEFSITPFDDSETNDGNTLLLELP